MSLAAVFARHLDCPRSAMLPHRPGEWALHLLLGEVFAFQDEAARRNTVGSHVTVPRQVILNSAVADVVRADADVAHLPNVLLKRQIASLHAEDLDPVVVSLRYLSNGPADTYRCRRPVEPPFIDAAHDDRKSADHVPVSVSVMIHFGEPGRTRTSDAGRLSPKVA